MFCGEPRIAAKAVQNQPMRILVTNDDGIDSPGLHSLAQRFTEVGDVTVVAPSGEYSGAGASIGHLGPGLPDVHRVERSELPDVAASYHLDGPPALCALLTCKGMLDELPDLVVSGINPGWNVGHSVHFSGTVGACITARMFGLPAIAVSQPVFDQGAGPTQHWATAAGAAADLASDVMSNPRLLNVNVPNLPADRLLGSKNTKLSDRFPYSMHSPALTERSPGVFAATFERDGSFNSFDGSDTHAVESHYVSVTELTPTKEAT